jgi:hypothetical protein
VAMRAHSREEVRSFATVWATPGILEAVKPGRMQGRAAQRKYPDGLRERAVKMLFEVRDERVRATASWPGSGVIWAFTRRLCGPG